MVPANKARAKDQISKEMRPLLNRLARIAGQINAVQTMMKNEVSCPVLIHQIHSVKRALDGLASQLMEQHLKSCVRDAIQSRDSYEEQGKPEEFMEAVRSYIKK